MSAIEIAALHLIELLRWGSKPPDAPHGQWDEWPYKIIATGEEDTQKLCDALNGLEGALKQRGFLK